MNRLGYKDLKDARSLHIMMQESGYMEKFKTVEQVLDFAIAREVEAYELYSQLANKIEKPRIHKILEDLALEELEHKAKLETVRAGEVKLEMEEVGNLGIADKVEAVAFRPGMAHAELLVAAMKKEEKSVKLYTRLAAACSQLEIKEIFLKLAQEETQHKLRFEIEYDLITF